MARCADVVKHFPLKGCPAAGTPLEFHRGVKRYATLAAALRGLDHLQLASACGTRMRAEQDRVVEIARSCFEFQDAFRDLDHASQQWIGMPIVMLNQCVVHF